MDVENYKPRRIIYSSRLILNGGFLPSTPKHEASACWYYCGRAMQILADLDEGKILEDDPDVKDHLRDLAIGVAKWYGLESPSEFLKYLPACYKEAQMSGLPWDERIRTPHIRRSN